MNTGPLQNEIDALRQQMTSLQQALEQARRENTILRQKLDALARRFFGKKSEHLDAAQLEESPPVATQAGRLNFLRRHANRSSYHRLPAATGGRSFTACT